MAVWQALLWGRRRWRCGKHCCGRDDDGGVASTALGEKTMAVGQALLLERRRWRCGKQCSGGDNDGGVASTVLGGTTMAVLANTVLGGTTMAVWQALLRRRRRWRYGKHCSERDDDGGVASTVQGEMTMVVWQALLWGRRRWRCGKRCSPPGAQPFCKTTTAARQATSARGTNHCSGGDNDTDGGRRVALRAPSPSARRQRRRQATASDDEAS